MRYLELGAEFDRENAEGKNSLHFSAEAGMISLFLVIKELGGDVLKEDKRNMTALDYAIKERREEMALVIISVAPEILSNEKSAASALELAVDIGSYRVTRHILISMSKQNTPKTCLSSIKKKCEDKDLLKLLVTSN